MARFPLPGDSPDISTIERFASIYKKKIASKKLFPRKKSQIISRNKKLT